MTEYVFKISTNDVGVVFETPDINPEHEDNVREGIAYLSAALVSIFINDVSKHIKENQKDFIFTAQTMIDNSAILKMGEKKMTQKFKFGDLVRRKTDGVSGVVLGTKLQSIWVVFEGAALSTYYDTEEFELIPHPDTVRLDWLADKHNKIGSVLLPRECVEKHIDSLRAAIDAAMQLPTDN